MTVLGCDGASDQPTDSPSHPLGTRLGRDPLGETRAPPESGETDRRALGARRVVATQSSRLRVPSEPEEPWQRSPRKAWGPDFQSDSAPQREPVAQFPRPPQEICTARTHQSQWSVCHALCTAVGALATRTQDRRGSCSWLRATADDSFPCL